MQGWSFRRFDDFKCFRITRERLIFFVCLITERAPMHLAALNNIHYVHPVFGTTVSHSDRAINCLNVCARTHLPAAIRKTIVTDELPKLFIS